MSKDAVVIVGIAQHIHVVRGQKVLLDYDLAELYGVATKVLNQAVKRHSARFPHDFMFRLTRDEAVSLRSQFVTLKRGQHLKYLPNAFTEQGVAMLSSVLNTERAVSVNIAIMRAFVQLRRALDADRELAEKFAALEKRIGKHDAEISAIIDAIRQLMATPRKTTREIGFHVREKPATYRTRKTR